MTEHSPPNPSSDRRVLTFEGSNPQLASNAWIAPHATVLGEVSIGSETSIWYQSVLRGDVMPIEVGSKTNIQDFSMVHGTTGVASTSIGDEVTVGHRATLHGCRIGHRCLIGMGAILLDGVIVEDECLIAAGTLLTPGTHVPRGSLVMGSPGRVKRSLTEAELHRIVESAAHYVELAARHRQSVHPISGSKSTL